MAKSAETKIELARSLSLDSMRKSGSPRGGRDDQRTSSICASGGGLERELVQETIEGIRLAFHLDQDAAGLVSYEAVETEPGRQSMNERAKTDSLNDSADGNRAAVHVVSLSIGKAPIIGQTYSGH